MNSIEKNNRQEIDLIRERNALYSFMHLTGLMYKDAYSICRYSDGYRKQKIYYADFTEALNRKYFTTAKFDSAIVSRDFLMLLNKKDLPLRKRDIIDILNIRNDFYRRDDEVLPVDTCFEFSYKPSNSDEEIAVRLYPHGHEGLREESNENFGTQDIALEILLSRQAQINREKQS